LLVVGGDDLDIEAVVSGFEILDCLLGCQYGCRSGVVAILPRQVGQDADPDFRPRCLGKGFAAGEHGAAETGNGCDPGQGVATGNRRKSNYSLY